MRKTQIAKAAMLVVAFMSISTAIAHLSCIWFGRSCYYFQGTPMQMFLLSEERVKLLPLVTIIVSTLFFISALYALSGARVIRKLPFLKIGILTISGICLQRGLHFVPSIILFPSSFIPFPDSCDLWQCAMSLFSVHVLSWSYYALLRSCLLLLFSEC